MGEQFKNITLEHIDEEHICCAIADKKHQCGVTNKKEWMRERLTEGHVFRKLDVRGKVFIEYAPLEKAWIPILGENYLYIYCLWVSGAFKGKGYGKALLEYCIEDARRSGKSGICILTSKKKKPYLSDKKFIETYGFKVVDTVEAYELLALSFDGTKPTFTEQVRHGKINSKRLTIYYGQQCPFIPHCVEEVRNFCEAH
ncbi:MAG: GNAT family N-acetyltransferase, partial [Niameybacter sp.]